VSVVVDSSAALAWYFVDEQTPSVLALLDRVADLGAIAPVIWRFEIANGLQSALRLKRIDAAYRDYALTKLSELDITVDEESLLHAWSATVRLADRHGLTVHDAAYLELAQRRRLPLATLDMALARAAQAEGIEIPL
jgi:predicted nucleic acid-binding protein